MSNLYEILNALCVEKGVTGYRMCKDCGIQPSIMTDLKMGRRFSVKADTAARIASYFDVTVSFLAAQSPFDFWDNINRDRSGFMHFFFQSWERPVEEIQELWNVNPNDPDAASTAAFVRFIDDTTEKVELLSDGEWIIYPKQICKKQKEKPTDQKVDGLKEVDELFSSLSPEQQAAAKDYLRFLAGKGHEDTK